MGKLDLTIIIPVYNREVLMLNALESVLSQSEKNFRVIIVDNNSSDGTLAVAQRFANEHSSPQMPVTVLQNTIPGASATRNCGLEVVDTDWVFFFDSDDCLRSNMIKSLRRKINSSPDADLILIPFAMHLRNGSIRTQCPPRGNYMANHIMHSTLCTQSTVVKTDFIRACGGWNSTVAGWNDWELGVRLLLGNPRIEHLESAPLQDYISNPDSITGTGFSTKLPVWLHAIDQAEAAIRTRNYKNIKESLLLLEYKRLMLAAQCKREHSGEGEQLYKDVISRIPRHLQLPYKYIYFHISHGMRGGSRLAYLAIKLFL